MQAQDYHVLFSQYIAVCNKALTKNKDKFPFRQIWQSVQEVNQGDIVDVQIIDDHTTPRFRMKMEQNQITEANCARQNKCCGGCIKRLWHVQTSYLQHVVENSDSYIDNPAMINWEWLQPDMK